MRHNNKRKHLGRSTSHRRAMLSNLVTALFQNGRIRTTEAKAKEGRRLAERLVTFAKRGDLHARRQTLRVIRDQEVVKRLFEEIGPRFQDRNGGYTRIVKLDSRLGDRAPMVIFELLDEEKATTKKGATKSSGSSGGSKKKRSAKKRMKSKESAGDAKRKEAPATSSADESAKKKKRSKKASKRT
jgi:large subunit ribosomal protein L17